MSIVKEITLSLILLVLFVAVIGYVEPSLLKSSEFLLGFISFFSIWVMGNLYTSKIIFLCQSNWCLMSSFFISVANHHHRVHGFVVGYIVDCGVSVSEISQHKKVNPRKQKNKRDSLTFIE